MFKYKNIKNLILVIAFSMLSLLTLTLSAKPVQAADKKCVQRGSYGICIPPTGIIFSDSMPEISNEQAMIMGASILGGLFFIVNGKIVKSKLKNLQ